MSVSVDSLISAVRLKVGDASAEVYKDADITKYIENNGVGEYNLEMFNQLALAGTGSSKVFSPTPNEDEKQLLILFTARTMLEGETISASRSAVSFSNPVSNVNLTNIPDALGKRIMSINSLISEKKKILATKKICGDIRINRLSRDTTSGATSVGMAD